MSIIVIGISLIISILLNYTLESADVLSFPFESLGVFLRKMSLSGTVGNIASWILYGILSLLPIFFLVYLKKKKKSTKVDYMLILLSITLFYLLYMAINPAMFEISISSMTYPVLGVSFYSILLGYFALRIIYSKQSVSKNIQIILYLLLFVFVFLIVKNIHSGMDEIASIHEGNQITDFFGNVTYIDISTTIYIMWISIGIEILTSLTDLIVIMMLIRLFKYSLFSEEMTNLLNKIYHFSKFALTIVIILNMANSIIQLLLINTIKNTSITAEFSLFPILFVLLVVLFTRFYLSSKQLKEENEMFI